MIISNHYLQDVILVKADMEVFMKRAIGFPLSLVVAALVSSASADIVLQPDSWYIIGSDRSIDLNNLVAQTAVNSVWTIESGTGNWMINSLEYNATELGYDTAEETDPMQGVFVRSSSSGGSITLFETSITPATSFTTQTGWNMLAIGSDDGNGTTGDGIEGVVFPQIGNTPSYELGKDTGIGLFKDVGVGLRVYGYDPNSGWQIWSPNYVSPRNVTILEGLAKNQGFWAYVEGGRTYSTSAWDEENLVQIECNVTVPSTYANPASASYKTTRELNISSVTDINNSVVTIPTSQYIRIFDTGYNLSFFEFGCDQSMVEVDSSTGESVDGGRTLPFSVDNNGSDDVFIIDYGIKILDAKYSF